MNRPMSRFLSVFTLVSRIPIAANFERDFSRTDLCLPLIGLGAALCSLAGWFSAQALFHEPFLSAIAALSLQYAAFNLFHLDGLLDSADAMAGHVSRERRLEILKDSRIGTYAFFFGLASLAAKTAAMIAIGRLGPVAIAAALLAAPVGGRAGGALVPLLAKPARPDGLGALMKDFSPFRLAAGWLLGSLPLAALWAIIGAISKDFSLWQPWADAAVASLFAAFLGGGWMARLYAKRARGFTGDAIGAAVEIGELACLLLFLGLHRLFS